MREETEQQAAQAQVLEAPPLAQKPIYVGVTIFENRRMASIIDPTNAGGGRKTQTRRIGDVYQGYTITDITESQMILENGNRREIIPLHDGAKRSGQGKTPILATRIVAIGGGAGGGASTPPIASSVPPGAVPRTGGPASAVIGGTGQRTTASPPTAVRSVPPQVQQQGAAGNLNEGTDAQGRRVIRTPFGDIVRDR